MTNQTHSKLEILEGLLKLLFILMLVGAGIGFVCSYLQLSVLWTATITSVISGWVIIVTIAISEACSKHAKKMRGKDENSDE